MIQTREIVLSPSRERVIFSSQSVVAVLPCEVRELTFTDTINNISPLTAIMQPTSALKVAGRRTGSYTFEPTFLLKISRFEKERLK